MLTFYATDGRVHLTLAAQLLGAHLNVSLFGGEKPHIGAVAVAEPRPSLSNPTEISTSCSVITRLAHKEDELARSVASTLARELNTVVCVACGIHLPDISPDEIRLVLRLCEALTKELIASLPNEYTA